MASHDAANQAMFLGDVSITGGTYHFTGEGGVTNNYNPRKRSRAFETLKGRVVTGALHNSGEVSDPPKCHPGTRVAILGVLMQWAMSPEYPFPVKWLHGPAGAGKSAIMRTLAEMLLKKGLLIASFFLSRTSANRNNPQFLISTIAYQLCLAIPSTRAHIEGVIDKNPLIFQLSLSTQAQALIAEPLIAVQRGLAQGGTGFSSFPRVIILDGLDECEGQDAQCEILRVLSDCISELPVPLALIVASRPEHHIRAVFDLGQLNQSSSRIALDDSFEPDADIERFFLDNFAVIKRTHPFKQYLPNPWPPVNAVSVLVQKASGQFIYASTVVKFISPIRYNPTDRLAIILGALDPGTLKPFEQLDLLYTTIFLMTNQEELPSALRVLGALMTPPTATRSNRSIQSLSPAFLESLLGLKRGKVRQLLFDLESLLSVTDDLADIRIFHASLPDFLFDRSRSKRFFIDKGMVYEDLARRCLRLFTSTYDHYLECYLVDYTRSYFEKATPTIELYRAITHTDVPRLAKLSVQSGQRRIIYGLRRLVPVFLRAVQQSRFPDANILFTNHLQSYRKCLRLELSPYLNGNWQTICLILAAIHLRNLPSRNLTDFLNVAGLGLSEDHHRIDENGLQILQDYNMKGDLSITTFVSDVLGSKLIPNLSEYYTDFAIYLMKRISRGSGFYVHNEEGLGSNTTLSFGLYVVDILPGIMRNSPVREDLTTLVEDLPATLHYRQAYCALEHAMNNYISRKHIVKFSEKRQPGGDLQNSQCLGKKAVLANPLAAAAIVERPNMNGPSEMHSTAKRTAGAAQPSANGKGQPSPWQKGPTPKPATRTKLTVPQPSHSKESPGTFTTHRPNAHAYRERPPRKESVSQPKSQGVLVDSDDPLPDRAANLAVREVNPAPIRAGRRQSGYPHKDLQPQMDPSLSGTTTDGKVAHRILPALVPTPSTPSAINAANAIEPVSEVIFGSNASWVEIGLDDGLGEDPQMPTSRRQRVFTKVDRFLERVKSGRGKKEEPERGVL